MHTIPAVATPPPVEPDPEIVTPGALGLVITVVLLLAIVLLVRSMNRHLHKIDFPQPMEGERAEPEHQPPGDDEQPSNS